MSAERQLDGRLYVLHDYDNNLLNTGLDLVDFHNERWNTRYFAGEFTEDFAAWWGVTQAVALVRWNEYCAERLRHIPPVEGAVAAVHNLSTVAVQDVLTSRAAIHHEATRFSAGVHFPAIAMIHHADIDWSHPEAPRRTKVQELGELKPDVYTEDQVKHCVAAVILRVPLIILRQTPQNKDAEIPPEVRRSRSWQETEDLIAAAAQAKEAAA